MKEIKSVFITGGTSGLGAALAKKYLTKGYRVGINGRDAKKFDVLFKDEKFAFFYPRNVSDREGMIEDIAHFSKHHPLDVVIANAGISMGNKSKIPDFNRARQVIDTNVYGLINTFEAALKIMEKQKSGHLVGVASVAGWVGLPGTGAYSASKSAVIKICETFSIDLKSLGIDVTCINPGFVDTPLTQVNPHPMPFLVPADKAAEMMIKAINKKKVVYAFPWQMKVVVQILRRIPRCLYVKIMRLKMFNYSTESH